MYALFCIFCFHRAKWHSPATLTQVFPCFFLSCKANARVYFAKTGHGPHSSQLVNCVVLCIVCVYMCPVLLPPGGNPMAVKYIISYIRLYIISYISYHTRSYIIYYVVSYQIIYHIILYHIISYIISYHTISCQSYHIPQTTVDVKHDWV